MEIIKVEQGSREWLHLRLGKVTGTRLKAVMGGSQAQQTLIYELVAEQLSGQQEKLFTNDAMQWGTDHEEEAINKWEKLKKKKSSVVGFCISDKYPFLGLSPDRLVETKGVFTKAVEVKCPTTKTAIKYRAQGGIPSDYKWQVVNYFLVCETLQSLDFVVYDPRIIDPQLQVFVHTVKRKDLEEDIQKAEERLLDFREEWKRIYKLIK